MRKSGLAFLRAHAPWWLAAGAAFPVLAQEAPEQAIVRGVVTDAVKCAVDPAQSYALYVPSSYSHEKKWSLLIGFHPGARGRAIVDTYQAAAEQYGFIVAGSNNSRNGSWAVSGAAAQAMSADLARRFSLDPQRLYLTGHSGGSRVALQWALANKTFAGVIASSAGYPDSEPRASVPFALFGTAGREDFNYIEMRLLDRKLTSPHRLALFDGGHALPPPEVALEAIEWMELQAMRAGRRTGDDALVSRLLEKRRNQIAASTGGAEIVHLLDGLVADFTGLRDVSTEAARAKELSKQPEVRKAIGRERSADDAEAGMLREAFDLEAGLRDGDRRDQSLMWLRSLLSKWSRAARLETDSPERSQARRVLRAITLGAGERVQDDGYKKLLDEYGLRGRP